LDRFSTLAGGRAIKGRCDRYTGSLGSAVGHWESGGGAPDAFFTLVPDATRSYHLSLCGSDFDTMLYVYDVVDWDDDDCLKSTEYEGLVERIHHWDDDGDGNCQTGSDNVEDVDTDTSSPAGIHSAGADRDASTRGLARATAEEACFVERSVANARPRASCRARFVEQSDSAQALRGQDVRDPRHRLHRGRPRRRVRAGLPQRRPGGHLHALGDVRRRRRRRRLPRLPRGPLHG